MTLLRLIASGGVTIAVLILCSMISIGIIIERWRYYRRRSRSARADFMMNVKRELEGGDIAHALRECETTDAPFARVAYAGLRAAERGEREIVNAMDRAVIVETGLLERHTGVVGTIGSTAVYIGLFGTVIGVMRAFLDIAARGTGGIEVVSAGISQALVTTAAGLIVAVPAVMAYNYFVKRIGDFITDMELCASEISDLMAVKSGHAAKG